MVDWKTPNLRDLSPIYSLPKQANQFLLGYKKIPEFGLLENQDSVMFWVHVMITENMLMRSAEVSFTGIFEKRASMSRISRSAGKELLRSTETAEPLKTRTF